MIYLTADYCKKKPKKKPKTKKNNKKLVIDFSNKSGCFFTHVLIADNQLEWNRDMCFSLDVNCTLIVHKTSMYHPHPTPIFYDNRICSLVMNINYTV